MIRLHCTEDLSSGVIMIPVGAFDRFLHRFQVMVGRLLSLDTLDHLTFCALYFSRIALELSFRTLHLARGDNSRNTEDNWFMFVLMCTQTSDFVVI